MWACVRARVGAVARTGSPLRLDPGEPGMDLAGYWNNVFHQDAGLGTGGGMLVDYGGIPLNEAGRLYALRWDASHMTGAPAAVRRLCDSVSSTTRRRTTGSGKSAIRTRRNSSRSRCTRRRASRRARSGWTDGRTHRPGHRTRGPGFATGTWKNNILTAHTTHLKRAWQRVNGVPQSDGATVTEYFIRHGDRLVYTSIVNDPVYLAEPWVRSLDFVKTAKDPGAWLYQCDDAEQIVGRNDDVVPFYLWGQNPSLRECSNAEGAAAWARSAAPTPSTLSSQRPSRRRQGGVGSGGQAESAIPGRRT